MSVSCRRRAGRLVALIVSLWSSVAWAEDPPLSDLAGREPVIADLAPRVIAGFSPEAEPSTLSVTLATRRTPERRDYAGTVLLTVPTDLFLAPRKAKRAEELIDEGGAASPPSSGPSRVVPSMRRALPPVRPGDARAAVSAAEDAAGAETRRQRIDDLATRARWSALLPAVRLRATRLVDESQSLSPTSYDPSRTTASGGASLWLEARTSWRLDRLLFASEEVAIERLRQSAEAQAARRRAEVLSQLGQWQKALLAIADPALDSQQCLLAELEAAHLAGSLDVLTDGWFSAWRARSGHRVPRCDDLPEPEPDEPDIGELD